jgi:release factor glutamine methyltransferase
VTHGPAEEKLRRLPAPSRREVLDGLEAELEAGGIEGARREAERLVARALDLQRQDLLLHAGEPVSPEGAGRIAALMRLRLSGVPLQHIEGTVAFRDLVLLCDDRALIPRPETEQLVQLVMDWAFATRGQGVRRVVRPVSGGSPPLGRVLDIGTGSGAIALSLLQEGIANLVVGVDLSARALDQARENATRLGLAGRIELRAVRSSPWDAIEAGERFDAIVSNPPYVADGEIPALQVEVRHHDPREALAGGPDGLEVIRQITAEASDYLEPGGAIFLEIGASQGESVARLLEAASAWHHVSVERDLSGRERFVTGRL